MSYQKQPVSPVKQKHHSGSPALNQTQQPANLPHITLVDSFAAASVAFRDPRWPSGQRQLLARQINQRYGNQQLQRVLAAATDTLQRDPQTPTYAQATTMADYVALVRAVEQQFSTYTPRQMLALLRQAYYGQPWSTSSTSQWQDVLPNSPNMGDPRGRLGQGPGSLFAALQGSQVVGGTDVGHLFTGLEALLDPTPRVEVEVPGPNPVARMPNTEFATWGGDLGSAAGQMVADAFLSRRVQSPQHYYNQLVSDADMEGNIDAYVLNQGAAQAGGLRAMLGAGPRPGQGTAISQILQQYYLNPTSPLGQAHQNRYAVFAPLLGATVQNGRITNQGTLADALATRITEFGYLWVLKEVRNESGRARAAAVWAAEAQVKGTLMPVSRLMAQLFFRWLEARL